MRSAACTRPVGGLRDARHLLAQSHQVQAVGAPIQSITACMLNHKRPAHRSRVRVNPLFLASYVFAVSWIDTPILSLQWPLLYQYNVALMHKATPEQHAQLRSRPSSADRPMNSR